MLTEATNSSAPRGLRLDAAVGSRRQRLAEVHVWPLTDLVEHIRTVRGEAARVPYFDPASGGVNARVLLLLEAPGPKAAPDVKPGSSGFVSLDNNDPTAERLWRTVKKAGLRRDQLLMWNIVPWYFGNGTTIEGAKTQDLQEASIWLHKLLELLPHLKVAVLVGASAQAGWLRASRERFLDIPVIGCPHPSSRAVNSDPTRLAQIEQALRLAAEVAETDGSGATPRTRHAQGAENAL